MDGKRETISFELNIPAAQIQLYYRGLASAVSVISDQGKSVQIPASILRPFVCSTGVSGRFVLEHSNGKLVSLNRLESADELG